MSAVTDILEAFDLMREKGIEPARVRVTRAQFDAVCASIPFPYPTPSYRGKPMLDGVELEVQEDWATAAIANAHHGSEPGSRR